MNTLTSVLFITLVAIYGNQAAFVTIYDSYCVRNIGCETEFQDMILGVSVIHDMKKSQISFNELQLWSKLYIRLLNKLYVNEVY